MFLFILSMLNSKNIYGDPWFSENLFLRHVLNFGQRKFKDKVKIPLFPSVKKKELSLLLENDSISPTILINYKIKSKLKANQSICHTFCLLDVFCGILFVILQQRDNCNFQQNKIKYQEGLTFSNKGLLYNIKNHHSLTDF